MNQPEPTADAPTAEEVQGFVAEIRRFTETWSPEINTPQAMRRKELWRWLASRLPLLIAADADRQRYAFLKRWLRAEPGHEEEMPEGWLVFSSHDFDAAVDDRSRAARSPEGAPNV